MCSEALTQRTRGITDIGGGIASSLVACVAENHMMLHARISFEARFIFNEKVGQSYGSVINY